MFGNNRFPVAVHAMALAMVARAQAAGRPVTSEEMANTVSVHPVHVRRVLGPLREAGLVTSQPGPGGGWTLARDPESITMLDIYRAVGPESAACAPERLPGVGCPEGGDLPGALFDCFRNAEMAMEAHLATVTLAHLMASARKKAADEAAEPIPI